MHGTDVGFLVALPKLLSHPSHLSPYSLLRAIFVTQCGDLCDGFGGLRFENTVSMLPALLINIISFWTANTASESLSPRGHPAPCSLPTGIGRPHIHDRRPAPVDVAMIGVGNVCVELSDVQVFILAEIQRRYILSFSAFIYTYGMECPIDIFGALDGSQITETSYVTMLVYVGTGRTILWRQLVRRRKSPLSESLRKRTIL